REQHDQHEADPEGRRGVGQERAHRDHPVDGAVGVAGRRPAGGPAERHRERDARPPPQEGGGGPGEGGRPPPRGGGAGETEGRAGAAPPGEGGRGGAGGGGGPRRGRSGATSRGAAAPAPPASTSTMSPGVRCRTRKLTTMIAKIVGTAWSRRRARKRATP